MNRKADTNYPPQTNYPAFTYKASYLSTFGNQQSNKMPSNNSGQISPIKSYKTINQSIITNIFDGSSKSDSKILNQEQQFLSIKEKDNKQYISDRNYHALKIKYQKILDMNRALTEQLQNRDSQIQDLEAEVQFLRGQNKENMRHNLGDYGYSSRGSDYSSYRNANIDRFYVEELEKTNQALLQDNKRLKDILTKRISQTMI